MSVRPYVGYSGVCGVVAWVDGQTVGLLVTQPETGNVYEREMPLEIWEAREGEAR